MRRLLTIAVVSAMATSLLSGTAYAPPLPDNFKCPGSASKSASGGIHPDIVRAGTSDSYQLTINNGFVGVWSPGDIDVAVCKPGKAPICVTHNMAGVLDSCAGVDMWAPAPNPPIPPGTYIVVLQHCTDAECGYDPANVGAVKLDLPYVLLWS